MNQKPIIKPPVKESFQYGNIVSWKFRDSITPERDTYCYRFVLTFSSGISRSMQKGGFLTKSETSKARENTISQLYSKEFIPFEYTIQEFYDYWLYYYMLDEKKIAYGTYMSYRNVIYNYVLKILDPSRKMTSIERKDIDKVLDGILSKSVLRIAYNVIRVSFQYAKDHQIIRINPTLTAIKIKKKKEKRALLLEIREKKKNPNIKNYVILSIEQVSLLLLRCKENYPEMYLPLLLSLTAGLRISETIATKFSGIDWGKGELEINMQLGRSTNNAGLEDGRICTQELKPKTHSGKRSVVLAEFVIDELILARQKYEKLREKNPSFHDLDYICFKENGFPYHRNSFRNMFGNLLKSCNIPHMRWHDLRHTYATILKQNEISLKAIAVCMGHSHTKITEDVYINLSETVFDCDKEIDIFIEEILPTHEAAFDIGIEEKYLLELLPDKVYNIADSMYYPVQAEAI